MQWRGIFFTMTGKTLHSLLWYTLTKMEVVGKKADIFKISTLQVCMCVCTYMCEPCLCAAACMLVYACRCVH